MVGLFRFLTRHGSLSAVALAALLAPVVSVPHARAETPPCRYEIKTDTVLDRLTGLTWQRRDKGGTVDWNEADAYCNGLALDGGGWRLPSIQELQTLIDIREEVAIDGVAFLSSVTFFWSSTPYAAGPPDTMWMIDYTSGGPIEFQGAHLDTQVKAQQDIGVRCIR